MPQFLGISHVSAWHSVSAQKKSVVVILHPKQLGEDGPLRINPWSGVICSKGREALLLSEKQSALTLGQGQQGTPVLALLPHLLCGEISPPCESNTEWICTIPSECISLSLFHCAGVESRIPNLSVPPRALPPSLPVTGCGRK